MNQPIVYAIVAMVCYSFSDFVYKQAATAGIRADATIFLLRSVAGGQASVLIPIAQMGFVTAPLGMFILRERVTVPQGYRSDYGPGCLGSAGRKLRVYPRRRVRVCGYREPASPTKCEKSTGDVFLVNERPMMLRDDKDDRARRRVVARNVLGEPLEICSFKPMTGFYRDGCCNTGREDTGSHTVCVVMTAAFLEFSKSGGNDLSTPVPEFGFPGLTPGDRWCLCAPRWQEAFEANQAPRVVLRATHEGALAYGSLADLKRFAVDLA